MSSRITVAFLITGIIALILSILYEAQSLALTGLGLVFFGALFSFVRPLRYVGGDLLNETSTSAYSTIDRIIKDFKYGGKAYYIPPIPETANLPTYLEGLRDIVVFIATDDKTSLPSVEDLSKGQFLIKKTKGILINPPGSGLIAYIEKQSQVDFTKMQYNELCDVLPRSIIENLNLGKSMELKCVENGFQLEMVDSLYANLYSENSLVSLKLLGDPIVSAVACAIAKASSKTITINKQLFSSKGLTLQVWYEIIEG